jgi:hypothetical protein
LADASIERLGMLESPGCKCTQAPPRHATVLVTKDEIEEGRNLSVVELPYELRQLVQVRVSDI